MATSAAGAAIPALRRSRVVGLGVHAFIYSLSTSERVEGGRNGQCMERWRPALT